MLSDDQCLNDEEECGFGRGAGDANCHTDPHAAGVVLRSSVSEGKEASDAGFDPDVFGLVGRHLDLHDEVGGVTRGRQRTCSTEHLVDGHEVDACLWLGALRLGHEVQDRQLNEQFLGLGLGQLVRIVVPLAALEVQSVGDAAALRLLFEVLRLFVIQELETERNLVDSDRVGPCIVLQVACEEGLWEEEPGDPVDDGRAAGDPVVEEVDPGIAVDDPGGEWLEREEALLLPSRRHLVVVNGLRHLVELLRHDDVTDERLLYELETRSHLLQQLVVSDTLLEEHCVHRLFVACRVELQHFL